MIRIGQKLRELRQEKNLSLEDVAKATKIRPSFLSAIEKGEYRRLPSSAYAQGFVRNYAAFLGLPKRESLALFRREFDEENIYKVLPTGFATNADVSPFHFRIHQSVLIAVFFLILLIGFILFQYRYAIINPPLRVDSPKDGLVMNEKDISVSGQTDANAIVMINGEVVTVGDNGTFTKTLSLFPGETVVEVAAKHRLGKETVIKRKVTVRE